MLDRDFTVNPPTGTATGTTVTVANNDLKVGETSTTGYDFLGFSGAAAGITLPNSAQATVTVSATLELDDETSSSVDRSGLGLAFTDADNQYIELYITPTIVFLNGPGRVESSSVAAPSNVETGFNT
jgi:hypothetical protein